MRMSFRILATAALLLVPSLAAAGPIIPVGAGWTSVGTPAADGGEFWDNVSVDDVNCGGFLCNAGALLDRLVAGNVEYLNTGGNPVSIVFEEAVTPDYFADLTGWKNGVLTQQPDGSFTYSGNEPGFLGHVSNSVTQFDQFALFRVVEASAIRYFLAIEDIRFDLAANDALISDRDYNDYMVSFRQATRQAPEPSLLLLVGTGIAGLASRRLRRAR